mgnify:CR=1 FL=1
MVTLKTFGVDDYSILSDRDDLIEYGYEIDFCSNSGFKMKSKASLILARDNIDM